jgi:hypothetical protein
LIREPKRPHLKKEEVERKELTKAINAENEKHFASMAATQGPNFTVVKGNTPQPGEKQKQEVSK